MVRRRPLCEKGARRVPPGWGWWEGNGGALCVVDYRLVHGYVDVREAVWGKGMGQVAGRAQGSKGGSGKGRAVVSPRRITLRKGTRGGRAAGRGGQGGNMVCRGLLCGKEEGRVPLG